MCGGNIFSNILSSSSCQVNDTLCKCEMKCYSVLHTASYFMVHWRETNYATIIFCSKLPGSVLLPFYQKMSKMCEPSG